jgi:hypothetical protein
LLTYQSLFAENLLPKHLSPYFSYSAQELLLLQRTTPAMKVIQPASLEKWDAPLYLIMQRKLKDGGGLRCAAYLYAAQRDAAYLTQLASRNYMGTLDPLCLKVIRLFIPDYRPPFVTDTDDYSENLSKIVFGKIKERFDNEQKNLRDYTIKTGPSYWSEAPPITGQRIGFCVPWLINDIESFRAPAPPPPDFLVWQYGLHCIREAQSRLSPEQIGLIYYWGGMKGPESGNWIALMNDYLRSHFWQPDRIQSLVYVRSIIAMAQIDAIITAFDSKYTYWVMRPSMRDPSIRLLIPLPKYPSYPSAHSVTAAALAVLLSSLLPENSEEWKKLAIQACENQIWSGLHFMIDNEVGMVQGERVGRSIMNSLQVSSQHLAQ